MQPMTPEDPQSQTTFIPGPSVSGPQPPVDPSAAATGNNQSNNQTFFYTTDQEDDPDFHLPVVDDQEDQLGGQSSPFVLPFQNSGAFPTIQMGAAGTQRTPGAGTGIPPSPPASGLVSGKAPRFPLQVLKYLLIGGVVLITLIGASLFVFAQPPAPSSTQGVRNTNTNGTGTSQSRQTSQQTGAPKATNTPSEQTSQPQGNQTQGQGTQGTSAASSSEVPSAQQLSQLGWTQAGLSSGDAIEALRTGATFTDREMSYDYRAIGTSTNHSGTLTASTFLLTSGGKKRFIQNDVRVINNVLYNKIRNGKIIQQVVNAQPSLVQFQTVQTQGQQSQFAWVNVSFELLQSKIDPASGQRTEGLERDAASGQPLVHHLAVVLVRVSLQNQGADPPMGGTGWLVNTYALDTNMQPAIATNPSV